MNSHLRIYTFKIKVLVLCQFRSVDSQNYYFNLWEPSLIKKIRDALAQKSFRIAGLKVQLGRTARTKAKDFTKEGIVCLFFPCYSSYECGEAGICMHLLSSAKPLICPAAVRGQVSHLWCGSSARPRLTELKLYLTFNVVAKE